MLTADAAFARVVDALGDEPGVQRPTGSRRFGARTLTVSGSVFAMLQGDHLVLKLPADRVAQLRAEGVGGPFGTGRARPMREWVTVLSDDEELCLDLAREALAFGR